MSKPELKQKRNSYEVYWAEEKVKTILERIKNNGRGLHAEISVFDEDNLILTPSSITLSSQASREKIIKVLNTQSRRPDWTQLILAACEKVSQAYREGEPCVEVWSHEVAKPISYLLHPLIIEEQPNFLYGRGGTKKSYLALLIAICLRLPWKDNLFGWKTLDYGIASLYLDWEASENEFRWRLHRLATGLDLPTVPIHYVRMISPLEDETEKIGKIIEENKIGFIVIDSLAAACGGNLKETQEALGFFRALRSLKTTALIIAHTSKEKGEDKTIYGNVFFENYGRNNWETRAQQEFGTNSSQTALFHRKANNSMLFNPIGLEFAFAEDGVIITKVEVSETPLSSNLPMHMQITELLQQFKVMTTNEIAEELGKDTSKEKEVVKTTLYRDKQRFVRVGDGWGLRYKEG